MANSLTHNSNTLNSGYRDIEVRPLSSAIGAEIHGVDIANGLSTTAFEEVQRAFSDFGVIFFRDQDLTPEQHVDFARCWGKINVNRFFKPVPSYPLIAEVRKEPEQTSNIGGLWHTDHSYDQIPATGSILYAREVPDSGGDTVFASMYAAYDTLSEGLKQMLSSLRAIHSSRDVFGPQAYQDWRDESDIGDRVGNAAAATQDANHPVVIRHPLSGRPALYVNPQFTLRFDGWTEDESRPLLEYLYQHGYRPEFTCRFRWQPRSLAMWDNRATWHHALNDYPGERRLMHRITLEGVALEPV